MTRRHPPAISSIPHRVGERRTLQGRKGGTGRGRVVLLAAALLLGPLGLGGCERGFPRGGDEATIEEDRFVLVMAELRGEMNERDGTLLPEAERAAILQAHGVTEEDLLQFADVHGPDVTYMHQVWIRVDSAMMVRSSGPGADPTDGEDDGLPPTEGEAPEMELLPPGD
jgi:hypothetical protein